MSVRTSRLWVWVALLLIAVGPYTAIAAQTDLASDGFIRLKRMAQEPPITNSWVETIQGTKGEDGVCHYSIEFSAAAGDTTPQFAAVRAVDPTTCAFELVRGTPTYIPAIDGDGVVVEDEASASVSASDQIAAQAQSTTQVRYSTYWEDPVELDVNKVSTSVRAYISGGSITSADCWNRRYWLSGSGWYEVSSAYGFLCDATTGTSQSAVTTAFQNDTFCLGNSTSSYYFRNTAYATPSGVSGWINDTYVYGGCIDLLSGPYHIFEPGQYGD